MCTSSVVQHSTVRVDICRRCLRYSGTLPTPHNYSYRSPLSTHGELRPPLIIENTPEIEMFAKDRVGFMPGLYVAFLEELSAEDKKKFEKLSCQVSRANMILNHPFISDKFDNIQVIDSKDNAKSVKAREEGNVLFQSGNFPASLVKYSSAVVLASWKSKELSLALANRSAALQRLKYHTQGVQDIDEALDSGYPVEKQFKILERRAQLLRELKLFDKARDCYLKASKLVHQSSLSEDKREKFKQEMDFQIGKLKDKTDQAQPGTGKKESGLVRELTEVTERHEKYKVVTLLQCSQIYLLLALYRLISVFAQECGGEGRRGAGEVHCGRGGHSCRDCSAGGGAAGLGTGGGEILLPLPALPGPGEGGGALPWLCQVRTDPKDLKDLIDLTDLTSTVDLIFPISV